MSRKFGIVTANHYICTQFINSINDKNPYLMKKILYLFALTVLLLSACRQEKEVINLPRTDATPEVVAAVDSFVNATQTRPVAPDSSHSTAS
jgi:hypothetical protein